MQIRSITAFTPLGWPFEEGTVAGVSRFLMDARLRLKEAGYEVQAVCLATPPFLDVVGDPDTRILLEFAQNLEAAADKYNIDFVSVGPVVATTPLALLMTIHALPQLITQTKKLFSGVLFADGNSGINLSAARAFAEAVSEVAQATPEGRGNFRLAALANVPAGFPYFPAAYHHGGPHCFAIATDAADLALNAIDETHSLNDARKHLIKAIEHNCVDILDIVDNLVDDHQIRFNGIDFSLASQPDQAKSLGVAVERLGVDVFGGSGTLFATTFLTSCIRGATIPRIGFSGVMLPVFEDEVLARRAAEGCFSLNDLLLFSASHSNGLDAIPIPGNTSPDEMAAIFLDMASLALSLGKPLMARLLPIPGLAVGEKVSFDSENFASTRVLPVKNLGAETLLERSSFLPLKSARADRNTYF